MKMTIYCAHKCCLNMFLDTTVQCTCTLNSSYFERYLLKRRNTNDSKRVNRQYAISHKCNSRFPFSIVCFLIIFSILHYRLKYAYDQHFKFNIHNDASICLIWVNFYIQYYGVRTSYVVIYFIFYLFCLQCLYTVQV